MNNNVGNFNNKQSIGWAISLLLNGLIWLFIGFRSGEMTQIFMAAGLLCAAFAIFRIKVLSTSRLAHLLFYVGSGLMLVAAFVSLR